MSEWISVKDRLPTNDKKVFVFSGNAINDYAYPYDYHDAVSTGFYSNGNWYYEDFSERSLDDNNEITHWFPLFPKPPKTQSP